MTKIPLSQTKYVKLELTYMRNFTNFKICFFGAVLLLSQVTAFAQSRTVTGKVTDAVSGDPLPGASVLEKGTSNGMTTDLDGNFTLNVSDDASIIVSYVGYISQEVAIGSRSVVNVELQEDVAALEEIVVVGYGTQRKEDLTGAVSLVDPEEMQKQAANDLTQQMQGRVAGVSITSDGQPGATPQIRIRGISTITGSTQPLFVVDGFPIEGGIRDVNPNDIESIQVLKDASAGAIYGNRAANGVVIITTKGGRKNQPFSVNVSSYYGFQGIYERLPVLSADGYQTINNEMLDNAGTPRVPGNDPNSPDFISDIDTDWQEAGFKDGYIANVNVNFSGGSENTSYFVSADYLDNEGTLVGAGPDYKRYSFRVNTDTDVGRVRFGNNVYFTRSDENPLFFTTTINLPGGRPSLVNDLLQAAPTIPVFDPNRLGGFGGADAVIHQSITLNVPGVNSLVDNSTLVNRFIGNLYGEIDILEGLTYKLNLSYDHRDIRSTLFVPEYDLGYFFPGNTASYQVTNTYIRSGLVENTLRYDKTFGKHDIDVLVGHTFQNFQDGSVTATGSGLQEPYFQTLSAAEEWAVSEGIGESALESYLGRLNYGFDDRYLLTFNIRRDGSSRFSSELRNAVFPSVGVAWKVHNDFNLPAFVSELKLRGALGEVGNQNIGNFAYQPVINRVIPYEFQNGRVFGGAATFVIDPLIQWETRVTRSIAADVVLLDGRLDFTAEYYMNESRDLLLNLPLPRSVGSADFDPSVTTNAGAVRNSGIELSGTFRQEIGDLYIEIAPNFYTLRNEVLDIGPLEFISGAGARSEVGRPLGQHFGWVFDGIFQNDQEVADHAFQQPGTAPGDIRYRDLNGDDVINEDDREFLGQGLPTYYYGLNIAASYKGFDFTIFGQGHGGNLINSNLYRGLMPTNSFTNWHEDILDRWTPENPSTTVPRVMHLDPNNNGRDSDRPGWLQRGDYLRIQTLSLGYSFPESVISRAFMKSLRVYATIQNLAVFQAYKGFNPDFENGILNPGFDFGTYPRPRTTMVGVQIKF